jgi:predicted GIY-YIG superfamily endonuclease
MEGLPTDRSEWRFAKRTDVEANAAASDASGAVTLFEKKRPVVYLNTNGQAIYVGKSNNFRTRWHQHMGLKAKGGRRTKAMRNKADDDFLWLIAVVEGFQDNGEALQFEWRCHKYMKKLPKGATFVPRLQANVAIACASAPRRLRCHGVAAGYVHVLLECLGISRWTGKSPRAADRPLTVHWFDTSFRPTLRHTEAFPYWPSYITERTASVEDKKRVYFLRPQENKEQNKPIAASRRRKHRLARAISKKAAKPRGRTAAAVAAAKAPPKRARRSPVLVDSESDDEELEEREAEEEEEADDDDSETDGLAEDTRSDRAAPPCPPDYDCENL